MFRRNTELHVRILEGLFESDRQSVGIASRDERCPRGRAYGRRRIGVRKFHTLPGQVIQHRGLVVGTPVAAQIAIAEVVGQDEYDVRTLRLSGVLRGSRSGKCRPCQSCSDEFAPSEMVR